jgi:MFS family permease
MNSVREPLFTRRFFIMCAFTFTVFLSAFQLLPSAPFHILALGGSQAMAGLFLGFLTYSSACSAPLTGALADRLGQRVLLIACSLVLAAFSSLYAILPSAHALLGVVLVHGVFWSALLSASSAYMTDFIPETRRAEGIGYWGLSSVLALAVAPSLGFALHRQGWWLVCASAAALNLVMAGIAWTLPAETHASSDAARARGLRGLVEWRVVLVSLTLFLCSFGYGGMTSFAALYAQSRAVTPKGLYFAALACSILLVRPIAGPLADRMGPRRLLVPCLLLSCFGLSLLALAKGRTGFVLAALLFGAGFGSLHSIFASHLLRHTDPRRRGATFGAMLAAFDTGIGTGSILTGVLAERFGYPTAFGVAAALAALAAPYFLLVEPRLLPASESHTPGTFSG